MVTIYHRIYYNTFCIDELYLSLLIKRGYKNFNYNKVKVKKILIINP